MQLFKGRRLSRSHATFAGGTSQYCAWVNTAFLPGETSSHSTHARSDEQSAAAASASGAAALASGAAALCGAAGMRGACASEARGARCSSAGEGGEGARRVVVLQQHELDKVAKRLKRRNANVTLELCYSPP